MKIRNVYKLFLLMVLFVALQSRSNGPGNVLDAEVSGAPGSAGNMGTCANTGCHTSNSFDPSLSIELLDGNSDVVDVYTPGESYTLRITNTPSDGSPAEYGFQAVSLNSADNQAGEWGSLGTGLQVVSLGGRDYAEHSIPSNDGTFELPWTAPAVGTGSVTFYAASIAADGNNSPANDGTASSTLDVTEGTSSSTLELTQNVAAIEVLPNPVNDWLNLNITSKMTGNFRIRVMDMNGGVVQMHPVNIVAGENRESFEISALTPGMYIVQLCGEDHLAAVQMLKK